MQGKKSTDNMYTLRTMEDQEELRRMMAAGPGEPEVCMHFGCGKTLTLQERLCGKKCAEHSKLKPLDIMLAIQWPDHEP